MHQSALTFSCSISIKLFSFLYQGDKLRVMEKKVCATCCFLKEDGNIRTKRTLTNWLWYMQHKKGKVWDIIISQLKLLVGLPCPKEPTQNPQWSSVFLKNKQKCSWISLVGCKNCENTKRKKKTARKESFGNPHSIIKFNAFGRLITCHHDNTTPLQEVQPC